MFTNFFPLGRGLHIPMGGRKGGGGGGAVSWWLSGGISASDCLAAYQAKGAASLAASYSNLNNPGTNDATLGVAPSWATGTGWTFNGTSQYLKTGVTPNAANYSLIVRASGGTAGARGIADCSSSPPRYFGIYLSFGAVYYLNGDYATTGTFSAGTFAVAGTKGYRDGVDVGITLSNLGSASEIYVGCRNADGTATYFFDGTVIALAIYDSALTASQVAAVTTAMAAL